MKRFRQLYKEDLIKKLKEEFNYKNVHQIPALEKIVVNMGVGEAVLDSKKIDFAVNDLSLITGQKPIICYAKKSNAAFKIRKGMPIGCKVTLRGDKMYEMLERLILVALPRIRDFRGFNTKSFDGSGNFSFGLKEQTQFAEIDYDKIDQARGMDITIVTTAKTTMEAKSLLQGFYVPFAN